MFYTYIIRSKKDCKLYTGSTKDLRKRFKEHNNDKVFSTKHRGPFDLIYYEACINEMDARVREGYLKTGMGKRYIKNRLKRFLSLTGFTFVEILIVTSLLSIIGLVLYGVFNSAVNIWDRVTREIIEEDVVIFYKKISSELRNTFVFKGIRVVGSKHRVVFPAIVSYQAEDGPKKGIGQVEYSFDGSKKTVIRRQANFSEIYLNRYGYKRQLLYNVKLLDFKYYYYVPEEREYKWKYSWQEEDVELKEEWLPLSVRIKLILKTDRGERSFVETISLPHGG